jgi:hypothetical protein
MVSEEDEIKLDKMLFSFTVSLFWALRPPKL